MICPKCGEKFDYYEPSCPWCGAPKPVEEPKSVGDVSPMEGSQEKEDECVTFESPRKFGSAIFASLCYIGALFMAILGAIIFFAAEGKFSLVGLVFFIGAISIIVDVSYSGNSVCKIKWYKDKFVICTRSDEFTFTFERDELYKIENDALGGKIFVFRKNKQCFYVNERVFPEVVDAMKKAYGISAE